MNNEMSYKDKVECGHYKDIIDCIQERVNILVKKQYESDSCYPIYIVSVLWENDDIQKIILNCTHLGSSFLRILFPNKEKYWGYDGLGDMIKDLYNQTM